MLVSLVSSGKTEIAEDCIRRLSQEERTTLSERISKDVQSGHLDKGQAIPVLQRIRKEVIRTELLNGSRAYAKLTLFAGGREAFICIVKDLFDNHPPALARQDRRVGFFLGPGMPACYAPQRQREGQGVR